MHVRRFVVTGALVFTLLALPLALDSSGDSGGAVIYHPTAQGARGGGKPGGSSPLLASRGGAVESTPAIFVIYWGPEWASGFGTTYSSAQAQNYLGTFFGGVGGSSWVNSTTQYCQSVASGTTDCTTVTGAQFIANPAGQLAGTYNDPTPVPKAPKQADIANAALRGVARFGYNANATYLVFTPSGKSTLGFGTRFCAWHSSTSSSSGLVAYANIPYQPDAGASCGMNFVNQSNDSFGHGYFDGFSIVAGHEYAEAVTDPFPNTGWLDSSGAENADKCVWISSGQGAATNIAVGGQTFAVQSLWSNKFNAGAGGCVISYP